MPPPLPTFVDTLTFQPTLVEDVFEESAGAGAPASRRRKGARVTGVYQKADVVNENNRLYPREILERELEKLKEYTERGECFAAGDHPPDGKNRISDLVAIHEGFTMDQDGVVHGSSILLDEGNGKIIQDILRKGGKIGLSSRGFGTASRKTIDGAVVEVLDDNFRLNYRAPFDFVVGQSTPGALVTGLTEQQKTNHLMTLSEFKEQSPAAHSELMEEAKQALSNDEGFRLQIAEGLREEFKTLVEQRVQAAQATPVAAPAEGETPGRPAPPSAAEATAAAIEEAVERGRRESQAVVESLQQESTRQRAAGVAILSILSEAGIVKLDDDGNATLMTEQTTSPAPGQTAGRVQAPEPPANNAELVALRAQVQRLEEALKSTAGFVNSKELKEYIERSLADSPYEAELRPLMAHARTKDDVDDLIKTETARLDGFVKRLGAKATLPHLAVNEQLVTEATGMDGEAHARAVQRRLAGLVAA